MTRLKTFNHVAAGLLQSFVSRNNDVGGFWALGVLYREVSASDGGVLLNLLDGAAAPSTPGAAIVASNYAVFLRRALLAKGIGLEELEEASVLVQFNTALADRPVDVQCQGDPFVCTVTLRSVHGKEAVMRAAGRCLRGMPEQFSGRAGH
ncbi:MAG TPA: hypothetical protein VF800_11835 [Telluria sp.]|jgi:hypothetical protein